MVSGDGDGAIERKSVVEELAERLRVSLFAGEIPPGERIKIKEIQARYEVSHIPIREALRILEAEGLVESQPQRGAVAAPVSVEILDEVYDARRLLEPQIMRRAAECASAQSIATAQELLSEMEMAEAEGFDSFFDAHRRFHRAMLLPGGSETLNRILNQLWGTAERFVRISKMAYPGDVEVARRQHKLLLELLIARDPTIGDVMEEHLQVTQKAIRVHYVEAD